jgi:hypothetical protein
MRIGGKHICIRQSDEQRLGLLCRFHMSRVYEYLLVERRRLCDDMIDTSSLFGDLSEVDRECVGFCESRCGLLDVKYQRKRGGFPLLLF